MIDSNDAPQGYEAKAPMAGKTVCAGCAFSDPPGECRVPAEAPACDKFKRKDGESVIFVKKGHELDEVVAVMQVSLSKFLGLEPPQPLLDAVKGADKERVQRNATAAVMRYVQCHKDTNSAS